MGFDFVAARSSALALAAAGIFLASPTHAATRIYNLTSVDSSAGLGTGQFGTVTVTEVSGSLQFLMSLAAGYRIHNGNANHNAFAFSVLGNPNVTVSDLTTGFAAVSTSNTSAITAPPFGTFYTGIDCTICGPGYDGASKALLSFKVGSASRLSLASLGSNSGVFFTTDLVNANGKTGNIGATFATTAVPEPATWAMLLLGFGMIGFAMRKRPSVRTTVSYA